MDSGLRKLSILAKLSRHTKISAPEIQKQLAGEGEKVSLRTIQRDLVELASKFPICGDESKPIGWYIDKQAELALPDFDLTTAVTFVMADKHLANLLPPTMRERLDPYIRTAKLFLRSESTNPANQWPKKVIVHSKGLPLHPTNISTDTIEAIYGSVLSEKCLQMTYSSLTSGKETSFVFHPYGIVVRSERSYLVGKYDGYNDIRQLALSRVVKAEQIRTPAELNPDFSLNDFVAKGEMGVARTECELRMKLWITPLLAKILTETPLSLEQIIEPKGDDFIVTASVDDTDELRHWILSMCNHATVIEPESLKTEIKETLFNSISYYE